jgi:hypothetical protein
LARAARSSGERPWERGKRGLLPLREMWMWEEQRGVGMIVVLGLLWMVVKIWWRVVVRLGREVGVWMGETSSMPYWSFGWGVRLVVLGRKLC